jgi:hypothetical protein
MHSALDDKFVMHQSFSFDQSGLELFECAILASIIASKDASSYP